MLKLLQRLQKLLNACKNRRWGIQPRPLFNSRARNRADYQTYFQWRLLLPSRRADLPEIRAYASVKDLLWPTKTIEGVCVVLPKNDVRLLWAKRDYHVTATNDIHWASYSAYRALPPCPLVFFCCHLCLGPLCCLPVKLHVSLQAPPRHLLPSSGRPAPESCKVSGLNL